MAQTNPLYVLRRAPASRARAWLHHITCRSLAAAVALRRTKGQLSVVRSGALVTLRPAPRAASDFARATCNLVMLVRRPSSQHLDCMYAARLPSGIPRTVPKEGTVGSHRKMLGVRMEWPFVSH